MMASRKPKEDRVEEVMAPDFAKAVRYYRGDIKPAVSKVGEHAQEMSTAYKAIKKECHIQPQAARAAFRLSEMEESKRDDYLRSFNGLLKELNVFMPADLLDIANGKSAGESVVPTGERKRPQLATIQGGKNKPAPEGDTDLADGDATESGVDKAKAAANADIAEDTFGIVNERDGKWLGESGADEDDVWVDSPTEAGKWTHADATNIVTEFDGGDTLAVRRIVD